ncbi:MAG: tetratricopeptide repeat protein [Candidatus Krumholzibacteriota bacterium]|nr:tetratricopeptide repeat protein [Candidatus Krumholzibacteriota bacterium]
MRGGRSVISFLNKRYISLALAGLIVSSALSCEKKTLLQQAEEEYKKDNFREAVFLVKHHFRRGGDRSPELLFISGKALLKLGRESDADDSFAEIYSIDSLWAPKLAEVLQVEAIESLEKGQDSRGKRFILRAVNYRNNIDFREYNSLAGELLLERKDYEGAKFYFTRYLAQYPDSMGAAKVMIDLGATYEGLGETIKAIDLYRLFQERYPKSRMVSTAKWKLENLLLNAGEELFIGGETDESESLLRDLAGSADNPLVREKANFMLAQIFESNHEINTAIEYYKRVIYINLGSSGRLAEKAKERIVELEKAR